MCQSDYYRESYECLNFSPRTFLRKRHSFEGCDIKMTQFRKLGLFKVPSTIFEAPRASKHSEIYFLDLES